MDHLPLPANASTSLPQVSYLCKHDHIPYDGSDFCTYPERNGFPSLNMNETSSFLTVEILKPSDDREVESVMQSWIFFGLLHLFFNRHGLYDAADYIEPNDGARPKHVHTRNLDSRLTQWLTITGAWSKDQQEEETVRLEPAIPMVRQGVLALTNKVHSRCDQDVVASLLLIFETLVRAIVIGLSKSDVRFSECSWTIPISHKAEESMIRDGWCPTDIAQMQTISTSYASRLYMQRLRNNAPYRLDHGSCSGKETCRHVEVDHATYQTRHIEPTCDCGLLGPDMSKIELSLQGDTFPVLRIEGDSVKTISTDVTSSDQETPYVAVSHVWADGLGNPKSNALPRCQILRMKGLIDSIRGQTFRMRDTNVKNKVVGIDKKEERDLAFWCDALCVPVGHTASTTRAIEKLRDVYTAAAYVLVLDSALENTKWGDIDEIEAIVRILTSRWMRRLWTLQEGALSQKLLFRFADRTVDLKEITSGFKVMMASRPSCNLFLNTALVSVQIFSLLYSIFIPSTSLALDCIVSAFCYRRVSYAADEPLCVAGLFDIDAGLVTAAHPSRPDKRMQEVWRQMALPTAMNGISQLIVFAQQPRLDIPGYRWAPITFQRSIYSNSIGLVFGMPTDPGFRRSRLTARGLCVSLPGWRIKLPGPPQGIPDWFVYNFSESKSLYIRAPGGQCFSITEMGNDWPQSDENIRLRDLMMDQSKQWYLIRQMEDLPTDDICRAFLAYHDGRLSGLHVLRTSIKVVITSVDPGLQRTATAVVSSATALRCDWKVVMIRLLEILGSSPTIELCTQKGMMGYIYSTIVYCLIWLFRALRTDLKKIAKSTSEIPEIAAVILHPNPDPPPWIFVYSILSRMFLGNVVEVVETFDKEQHWIID